jgi:hypothetical protein
VRSLLASAAVALALVAPAAAEPGRIAVGVAPDASRKDVASLVSAATGGTLVADLGPLDALVFAVADRDAAAVAAGALPGVEYAEAVRASRSLAFVPNDPLAGSGTSGRYGRSTTGP